LWNENNEAGSEKACDTFTNDTLQKPSNAGHENQDWPKNSLFFPSYEQPIFTKTSQQHNKKNTLLRSEAIVEVEIWKWSLKDGGDATHSLSNENPEKKNEVFIFCCRRVYVWKCIMVG
jgi:hypothetical protein